ncbi:MAG: hypothetical protein K2O31_03270 [Clostridia bacterium]|nr:hypothetical protein [Clostridia bacterium]MDE7208880.1 hypothetical protein [Clostridia bacterium]
MKMCNSEAMKAIKELESKKRKLIYNEDYHSKISYKEGEEKVLPTYDYSQTRKEICEIDERVRKIKHALAVCNCNTVVDDFGITIGEALVYLAQLNAEYAQLDEMSENVKLSRRITPNGIIEYTECMYDPEQVAKDMEKLHAKIGKLQIAIDRANLTNYIDV